MIKGLEVLEEINKVIPYFHITNEYKVIEKELKALEIIKKYNIRPSDFNYHTTYKIYLCNMSFAEKDEIMSEQEYDLLKEDLL